MSEAPPFTISQTMLDMVFRIGELVNSIEHYELLDPHPKLRKQNRIRSIHSSCAIEANSLSVGQVEDIIDGRKVIGPKDEVLEVKNAIEAYSLLGDFDPYSMDDFLKLHGVIVRNLEKEAGRFRSGAEGVFAGDRLVYMCPPPEFVPSHMENLFAWLNESSSTVNPLIASCVFHYEMVFIHPFSDGNGRMARLWQTALLGKWKAIFHWIPIENRILKAQQEYYDSINFCNSAGNSNRFIEFMLRMILNALEDSMAEIRTATEAPPRHLTEFILKMESGKYYSVKELMELQSYKSRPSFLRSYIKPAREHGLIEMEYPDSPRTTKQRYKRTE